MVSDYHNGQHRHRTFPSLQKILLDRAVLHIPGQVLRNKGVLFGTAGTTFLVSLDVRWERECGAMDEKCCESI